ncbi:hypothetical protein [Nocardioides sp. NPDC006303]|uniref:hypothetical protein n=1 Tax=Nocardioides sp. NPDC006303 TaxID=3156747 RepID=UPI0033AA7F4F
MRIVLARLGLDLREGPEPRGSHSHVQVRLFCDKGRGERKVSVLRRKGNHVKIATTLQHSVRPDDRHRFPMSAKRIQRDAQ